jgi:enamine deaminase RidA (YjgF/YER057c/UK114 family)
VVQYAEAPTRAGRTLNLKPPRRPNMFKRIPNQLIGGFSDAVVVEMGEYSTIHISGHVGNDASGKVTAKTFAEEVDICIANVARALERSGPV